MKPGKVVIDTNIWISYFRNNRLDEIARLILDNDLRVLTSPYLVTELETVLQKPKFKTNPEIPVSRYIYFHLRLTVFEITMPRFSDSPDPEDNFLFDLAIQHNATRLVTGEKRLLSMKEIEGVQLITLAELKSLLTNFQAI